MRRRVPGKLVDRRRVAAVHVPGIGWRKAADYPTDEKLETTDPPSVVDYTPPDAESAPE